MFFGRLLPREGNFFEMFNQHAEQIVVAARAFSSLVDNYNDVHLREKYNRDVDIAEEAADKNYSDYSWYDIDNLSTEILYGNSIEEEEDE